MTHSGLRLLSLLMWHRQPWSLRCEMVHPVVGERLAAAGAWFHNSVYPAGTF